MLQIKYMFIILMENPSHTNGDKSGLSVAEIIFTLWMSFCNCSIEMVNDFEYTDLIMSRYYGK